ncbi:hypothetical protein BJY52DRAFT_1402869 [Lactarius psammicola]|nr:hypothetical protein BJY52DRAFT_1402869 [Lactarius psammicola]
MDYFPIVESLSMAVPRRSIHEIDSAITQLQYFLQASPQSHPFRPTYVYGLAKARLDCYELSYQEESDANDLDNLKGILHLNKSILLQPQSLPEPKYIKEIFSALTVALSDKHPAHATYAAKYLRHLRNQPHAVSGFPHHVITTSLVDVLAFQALKASNVMHIIEEMAVLCQELLTSDPSDDDTTSSITLLSSVVSSKICPLIPDQPKDKIIECLRLAKVHKPELRRAHFALALCLRTRYLTTLVNDDYEEAVSILDEIISSRSPGDSQDKDLAAKAQVLVTVLAIFRSSAHKSPEYSEEAIYRARVFLSSSPVEHPLTSHINRSLEDHAKLRFNYFGSIDGLEVSSSNSPLSQPQPVVFHNSEFIQMSKKGFHLEALLSVIRNNDIMQIDEAIIEGRSILASFSSSHPLASTIFELFGQILDEAFECTYKIKYLNESISIRSQVLGHPSHPSQDERFRILSRLSQSLLTCSLYFQGYRTQDLHEGLKLLSQCVNDGHANFPDRFQLACTWATVARRTRHPSISKAYESAVSLVKDTLLFAPTLQLQHATLATSDHTHRMLQDYASYWVGLHRLKEVIETLERGRAMLWSEMRHLHVSVDKLLQTDPDLAHKFGVVSRDLEELTKSVPPSRELSMDDSAADDLRAVDPFSRLLLKQRRLLKERDNLILQIQALPGFDGFLTSPSFDILRSAASSGPIIIINHSRWRSDILILLHNTSPSLITTPDDFYHRASALKDKLLNLRCEYGLNSSHYDEALASVLSELYILVGKPVINRLCQLKVPEQSRIWWCPTSVFCSLPLHAMGPIPSDDGEMRYFLDLYICSYTPTLSTLIQSHNCDSDSRSPCRRSKVTTWITLLHSWTT